MLLTPLGFTRASSAIEICELIFLSDVFTSDDTAEIDEFGVIDCVDVGVCDFLTTYVPMFWWCLSNKSLTIL